MDHSLAITSNTFCEMSEVSLNVHSTRKCTKKKKIQYLYYLITIRGGGIGDTNGNIMN